MNNIDIIRKNVQECKTGAVTIHNPQWDKIQSKLEHMRIHVNTPLPDMKHLLNINGVNCFPRGDLVAISGKEKCGKTTDCRIIVSALLKGEYMGVKAVETEEKACVLWIDTEQASQTARAVCRGLEMMCCNSLPEDKFVYFALREYPDREELTEAMRMLFDRHRPDIAIIDGIRDFIPDFNDVVQSSEIVLECMRLSSGVDAATAGRMGLSERKPCCVCCILHQNKPKDDSNMRGHLGTELSNKAGEVWEATQDDGHVFSFTQTRSRTRPVDAPLRYKVGSKTYFDPDAGKYEEIGIPELWTEQADDTPSAPPVQNIKTSQGWFPKKQETAFYMFWTVMGKVGWEYNELKKVFTDYWGVDYYLFNDLVKLTDGHVYRVIENGRKLWRYNGPRYD